MPAAMSEEQRQEILRLHADGVGRNAIAAAVGRSNSSITNVVRAAGRSFDITNTELAVKTRSVKLAEARQRLAEELMLNAEMHARDARSEYESTSLGAAPGGGSAFYTIKTIKPPARDRKDLLGASSIAANTAMKLVEFDRGTASADVARSMVGGLIEQLTLARDTSKPSE